MDRIAIAEQALLEGDVESARRIVDVVLAREPGHPEALRLAALLRANDGERAGIPSEALGDLRPDTRHLDAPPEPAPTAAPRPIPAGVILLAALSLIVGAIVFLSGIAMMLLGQPIALLLLPVGAFEIAIGVGTWRLRPWAWYVSVVGLSLSFVANVFTAAGGSVASFFLGIFQLLVLIYLVRVRGAFLDPPSAARRTPRTPFVER